MPLAIGGLYTPRVSIPRRTLAAPASIPGRGLFTGKACTFTIAPAGPGSGIVLRRAGGTIPATIAHLAPQPAGMPARNTIIAGPAGPFITTEHALSALVGLGVTDAVLDLDAPEFPIGDGSAAFIVQAVLRAGLRELPGTIAPMTLTREITVEGAGSRITARPRSAPGCSYTYELDYGPDTPIPAQRASFELLPRSTDYAQAVAPARTFCLQAEAEQMRAAGLFEGLSPRDLLVIGPDGPIDNAYRFENEPARHKLLDLIGDLALVGRPIQADITATRAGHALNHQLARALV